MIGVIYKLHGLEGVRPLIKLSKVKIPNSGQTPAKISIQYNTENTNFWKVPNLSKVLQQY